MVTTIYLIRHAEAMGNVNEIFQGHTDCEISPKGKQQLEFLKERCKNLDYDVIFSSPLKRAVETAEAVNFHHKLPIKTDKNLMEINGGLFEGQKWSELAALYPEAYDLWVNNHSKFTIEGGESMEGLFNRITLSVTQLAARNRGKNIAIVSHGCAIRNFLCYASDKTLCEINDISWSDNTAISKIEFDHNLKPTIVFQNDATHLDDQMSTLAHQTWWKKEIVSIK